MSSSFKKSVLFVVISTQIRVSFQLNALQIGMKSKLVSSTENLDPKIKIELADYLKSAIGMIPILPAFAITSINEVIDEFKSDNLSILVKKTGSSSQTLNLADLEYIYGNIFANKVQQNMSQEELNRFMKFINEDEQSSKMSSARYLTIYLENKLKKVAETFTKHSEKLMNQLTTETINEINNSKTI